MKKKCTASACRKMFHYHKDEFVVCPFCGKEYPRQNGSGGDVVCKINGGAYNFNAFKKVNPEKIRKIEAIKMIRSMTGVNLKAGKYMADMLYETGQLPASVIISGEYGREIKMSGAIRVWKRRT